MSLISFSSEHLEYLTRSGFVPGRLTDGMPLTRAALESRRILRVRGIGRLEKKPLIRSEASIPIPSQDLLMGLYGYKIPLAFLLRGSADGVEVCLGTWSPDDEHTSAATLDSRQEILGSMLDSLFSQVDVQAMTPLTFGMPLAGQNSHPRPATPDPWVDGAQMDQPERLLAGLALGIPTAKPPGVHDRAWPIDRLIRAMTGVDWTCLVLAQPLDEGFVRGLRLNVINEMRAVESGARDAGAPSPLAEHYLQLLQPALINLTYGESLGAWRTAVYLLGDRFSYYRLASAWKGIFSGEQSLPEPVQVWDLPQAAALAMDWALPDVLAPDGPGFFKHAFEHQTLLSSLELAAYVHLPELETAGFKVSTVPDFDAVPAVVEDEGRIELGRVVHRARPTQARYEIDLHALDRHAFVAGVTGAGKTNTVFHLLENVAAEGIPFLVLEPAKKEYRQLLGHPHLGGELVVFTLGDERLAPFRINPFEVSTGVPVGVHLDLLRSVFSVSFGMWTPLPQILEICLHEVYRERGWDLTANVNRRLGDDSWQPAAFPTLTDLAAKVDEVTLRLGYDREVTANTRAALLTRINSLRTGGKGRMLDVRASMPMEVLLSRPAVLELEAIGDDNDKAFLMGLLLIRLAEHRRGEGASSGLRHVLVIEEAHRLLANVGGRAREEEADPRGQAVERFANLLSEVRAYGQGVIVADQIPVKLAPDVIKNTNLKIAHRVVAADDRMALAGAMAMNERQAHALATLRVGEAAVFAEGDDAPLLVRVPLSNAKLIERAAGNMEVQQSWARLQQDGLPSSLYQSYATCATLCSDPFSGCINLRRAAEQPEARAGAAMLLLSLALTSDEQEIAGHLEADLPDLLSALRAHLSPGDDRRAMHCALTHVMRAVLEQRGGQYGWRFELVGALAERVLPAILAAAAGQPISAQAMDALAEYRRLYQQACAHPGPYQGCEQVCGAACFHRHAVQSFALQDDLQAAFRSAVSDDEAFSQVASLADYVVDQILLSGAPPEYRRQAAGCFVVHQIHAWREFGWEDRSALLDSLLSELAAAGEEADA